MSAKETSFYVTGGTPQDWLFLAMAYQKLGQEKEARQCLVKAVSRHNGSVGPSRPWQERLEVELLSHEAQALISPARP